MKKIILINAALAVAAITQTPAAHAQFANVDPVQAGHAIQQIQQAAQLYSTTQQATQNAVSNYNLAKQMASSPSMLFSTFQSRSQQWVGITPSANTYGNTNGWINAVTTGNLAAVGNQQVSIPRASQLSGYGQLSPEGQRSIAAQGASADLGDTANSTTIQTLGTIRASSQKREQDITNLEAMSHSSDPSQRTEMATLQRINQALLIELRSQQEANQMLQAQAMQQMVGQKVQQDNLKSLFQTGSNYQQNYNAIAPQTTSAGTQWAFHY
jgi:hypothetical protein